MNGKIIAAVTAAVAATSSVAVADDAVTQQQTTTPASTTTVTSGAGPAAPDDDGVMATSPSASTSAPARDTITVYETIRPNRPLLVTGGAMFVGTYATTAALTAANDLDRNLYIPVVGPWVHLADQPADASTMDTVLVAGSGVLQGAGALLTAASFLVPEKIPAATIEAGNTKIQLTPASFGRASAGLGAVGTF